MDNDYKSRLTELEERENQLWLRKDELENEIKQLKKKFKEDEDKKKELFKGNGENNQKIFKEDNDGLRMIVTFILVVAVIFIFLAIGSNF